MTLAEITDGNHEAVRALRVAPGQGAVRRVSAERAGRRCWVAARQALIHGGLRGRQSGGVGDGELERGTAAAGKHRTRVL